MNLVKHESKTTPSRKGAGRTGRGGKRKRGSIVAHPTKKQKTRIESDEEDESVPQEKAAEEGSQEDWFEQPALVTGGKLKSFQLEGVAWMVSLWNNGISGILG